MSYENRAFSVVSSAPLQAGGNVGLSHDDTGSMSECRLDVLFARQAGIAPDAVALIHNGSALTYRDLELRANRLAHHLGTLGVNSATLAGVCLERTPQLIVTLLAILKAGAAYVPLDPDYPSQRLNFILQDSAPVLVITRGGPPPGLVYSGSWLDLDAEAAIIDRQSDLSPDVQGDANDLACVIYTSGSTGEPKGVMLRHSASTYIDWTRRHFDQSEISRIAATTSVCFDPSVFELFAPLCTGGTIILKQNLLEDFTADECPTLLNGVPSAFAELARKKALPDSVRVINIGGETCKPGLVRELYQVSNAAKIYNHYGPTETTICATLALIPREADPEAALPIGKPIAGARVYVLDPAMQPVRDGESGELYIAGETLALGYLNRPELTAQRFVPDTFDPAGGRMYRTGDLVRWSEAGELEFLGRLDQQVKLHGFRIELGEIESAVLRMPDVRKAVAMIRQDKHHADRLVLYVETVERLDLKEVRRYLGAWLPDYMLPSLLVILPAFPTAPSGKIDRNALPNPDWKYHGGLTEDYLPPVVEAIVDTFQDVLGCELNSLDDNFFELGGDSLLAFNVVMRLEELLGQTIPPVLLFQAPTPRLLAPMLENCPLNEAGYVAVLQAEGEKSPLFCLSDIFGRPLSYVSLARHLAPDQPVYGLSPWPLKEVLASDPAVGTGTIAYLVEIRRIQPEGPYRIAGYSSGGVAAFDLARALQVEGEDVTLILLDSFISRRFPSLRDMVGWASHQLRKSLAEVGWLDTVLNIIYSRRIWLRQPKYVRMREVPSWITPAGRRLARSLMQADKNYDFKPFKGSTVLIECTSRGAIRDFLDLDGYLGWRGLFEGPVIRLSAEVDHYKLMREPFAGKLADLLRNHLP